MKLGKTGRAALAVFGVVFGAIGWIAVSNQFKRPPAPRVFRGASQNGARRHAQPAEERGCEQLPGIAIEELRREEIGGRSLTDYRALSVTAKRLAITLLEGVTLVL